MKRLSILALIALTPLVATASWRNTWRSSFQNSRSFAFNSPQTTTLLGASAFAGISALWNSNKIHASTRPFSKKHENDEECTVKYNVDYVGRPIDAMWDSYPNGISCSIALQNLKTLSSFIYRIEHFEVCDNNECRVVPNGLKAQEYIDIINRFKNRKKQTQLCERACEKSCKQEVVVIPHEPITYSL